MKSILISIPCSLVVSLLVADVTLATLQVAKNPQLYFAAVAITTMLLYERGLAELGIIGAFSLFAQINAQGLGSQAVAPEILLAVVVALIVLPWFTGPREQRSSRVT